MCCNVCRLKPRRIVFRDRWQQRERMLPQPEIVLWTTLKGPPKASQASECSELLDLTRAAYLIAAQRQPGKFTPAARVCLQVYMPNTAPPLRRLTLGESLKKLSKSHQCAPSTATFSKRRNVGARNAGGAATSLPVYHQHIGARANIPPPSWQLVPDRSA